MTSTYIDSQSLGGVIVALSSPHPRHWSRWTTHSALTSTAVLLSVSEVRVSPSARSNIVSLRAYAGVPGPYGAIGAELIRAIKPYTPNPHVTQRAAHSTVRWATENPTTVAARLSEMKQDGSYEAWIDHESTVGWPTSTLIINGLIDEKFVTPIAKALSADRKDVQNVLERSRDPSEVIRWSSNDYRGEDKQLAKDMFSTGALLRGRYQDRVAELSRISVIHHPLRDSVLKQISSLKTSEIVASNVLEYLSKIVIASSLSDLTVEARVKTWSANINALRTALLYSKLVHLPTEDLPDEVALKIATRAAQDAEIRTPPKYLDRVVHHAVGLGMGAATSFMLQPWMFPVGFAASEVVTRTIENHLVPTTLGRSSLVLQHLAKSIPGRLRRS